MARPCGRAPAQSRRSISAPQTARHQRLCSDRNSIRLSRVSNFDTFHGLSTTSKPNASVAQSLGATCQTIQMPMIGLAELWKKHGATVIDFLGVDVEGAEADVLVSGDWGSHRAEGRNSGGDRSRDGRTVTAGGMGTVPPCARLSVCTVRHSQSLLRSRRASSNCRAISGRASSVGFRSAHENSNRACTGKSKSPGDHALAQILANGFWANLPFLDRSLLVEILKRGRKTSNTALADLCSSSLDTDEFRAQLGRIACGYDGDNSIQRILS